VLLVPADEPLSNTAVARYIAWGREQGFHQRHTCLARETWYSLPPQEPAPIILPKGIWHRHLAPVLDAHLVVDQQLYRLQPARHVPLLAAAALFNSAWFALQVELHGRVNLGKGLLWLAAYELDEVRLPDPRRLLRDQLQALAQSFLNLTKRPFPGGLPDYQQPERRALDQVVFDILHFSSSERTNVINALEERLTSRRLRAQSAA
jgi:hypothetical protein